SQTTSVADVLAGLPEAVRGAPGTMGGLSGRPNPRVRRPSARPLSRMPRARAEARRVFRVLHRAARGRDLDVAARGGMMPLFIDRRPFHCWIDATRSTPLENWSIVLPVLLTDMGLTAPPATAVVQEWALDTGNRAEAFAWRHHLLQAGLDPDRGRMPQSLN